MKLPEDLDESVTNFASAFMDDERGGAAALILAELCYYRGMVDYMEKGNPLANKKGEVK